MLLIGIPPSIETGPADPKISTGFAGIADLLGVLEHSKLALNVAFVVRHEYFLHPKSGKLQEVSRESVHIYTKIQTVETLVSQFSIVPAVIKQVAVKVIGLPYLPRKWFAD